MNQAWRNFLQPGFFLRTCRKKSMRVCLCVLFAMMITACNFFRTEVELGRPRLETGDYYTGGNHSHGNDGRDTSLYVTCVEFPPEYHWQQDSAGEETPFRIVVYKDGEEILGVDGGQGAFVSPHPDMHRFIDGHLYTDYSTNAETVFMKDGAEIFRYQGREMVCGFIVKDGDVYTLGQNRSGKGLSMRKNGVPLFSNTAGQVVGNYAHPSWPTGAISEDGNKMEFFYKIVTGTSKKETISCYQVTDGVSSQIKLDNRITQVHDIRTINGNIYILADMSVKGMSPVLFSGDDVVSYAISASNCQLFSSHLLWSGDNIYIASEYSYDNWKRMMSSLWKAGGTRPSTLATADTGDYYVDGEDYAYASVSGGIVTELVKVDKESGKNSCCIAGRYTMMSTNCASLVGENFYAGLSSLDKGVPPVIFKNNVMTKLKINGYISSISVVP